MTSTTALASRPAIPTLLTTAAQAGATPGAAAGAGRSTGASAARGSASPVLAARTAASGGTTASKAKASAAKKTTTKKTTGTASATKTGYAKGTLPADYAFLRDPKLSLEEKLSRFIGLVMSKAENDLLAQMEKMAGGSKAGGASGSSGTSGTGAATAPKKVKGFSVWGALKVLLPQVGLTTKLLGEAATKKLVQQLTGPMLAAAATAVGLPHLAPLALQAGKALGAVATDDAKGAGAAVSALGGLVASSAVSSLTGGAGEAAGAIKASGAAGSGGSGGAAGAGGGTSKAAAGGAPSSNMADQLELQRLMERQKETFSVLSNILRMNHEARMTSIQNLR